jgi:CHAT domain-containing protein
MLIRIATTIFLLALCQSVLAQNLTDQTRIKLVVTQKATAESLLREGLQKYRNRQYQEALKLYQDALQIFKEQKNRLSEKAVLQKIGVTYNKLGKYEDAIKYLQQAIILTKEMGDRTGEASILNDIGGSYQLKGSFLEALQTFQQALAIRREVNDRVGEGRTLSNIGAIYDALGKYPEAIASHQQALTIFEQQNHRQGIAAVLNNIGLVQSNLGKYNLAIELYQKSLVVRKEIGDRIGEGQTLHNIGYIYSILNQNQKAIEYYQRSLSIRRDIKDQPGEAITLNNLGYLYSQTQPIKAIPFLQQALVLFQQLGDQSGESNTLDSLGIAHQKLGKFSTALNFYQQALAIFNKIGDRSNQGKTLNNIGELFVKLKRPELAILFYKQSINIREAIRKDISKLDKDIQKSYLATVEKTYRNLADLLLKQDRILEAQQVLDLLKVEELNEYLRTPTRSSQTEQGTELRNQEKTFIALALELDELQKRKLANNITAAEQERLNKLVKYEQEQQNQFIAFLDSDPVQTLVEELRLKERQQNVDITNNFQNLRTDILSKYPNAVLLYPLILDDRLELILVTAKTTPIRRTINIKREKLNQEITDFLAGLRDSGSEDVKKPAQQMYTWLIKPFETELAELKIDTIIYAPDGQLRYIPLAALHDGKQWLIEKYRVNNITAASLTKFNKPPISTPKIFAGAFGNVNKQGFSGLPATITEVKKIRDRFPNTTTLIETAFTKELTTTNSNSYTILHLATHGQLSTGDPKDSFIIFGDGEKATISDIRRWSLTNVDLVVLSACQSGLGAKLGSGVEILGLGYQMQAAGARVAIASLWKVDDAGTQALMEAFYDELKKGDVSVVEALRRAQIAMINSDKKGTDSSDRAGVRIVGTVPNSSTLSHPYYWSAFFAIGNGL